MSTGPMTATAPPTPTERRRTAALRKHLVLQLLFELALPLGAFYGLQAAGTSQWAALTVGSLLAVPWLVHGMIRRRHVDALGLFTLCLMLVGALMSLVTGDPRVLLVRDSWLFGLIGLWILGTLPTRRPFFMFMARTVVTAKLGETGWRAWASRWDTEPAFRRRARVLTAVWGAVFTLDAAVRVILALTLPVGSVPLVSTLQWLAVLTGLLLFHKSYVTRHGLKA
ncbi:VC0807 family protein [Streptomyces sp. I05A-00742]|uniref:VC0807 family protein n=1 Tax=Streptomyces sp. I05A-00742 TaxID=2732853 RepID=UPI0014883497|nr:VC0807 family protein [Streptomyces sp. I05A-00742]